MPKTLSAGGDIFVEETQIIKICSKETQTDEPRDMIEELKKFNIQILKKLNLLKSGKFQVSLVKE